MENGDLSSFVRRHDPDRFFATLFAPAEHRPTLFALYALNHELARAAETGADSGTGLIRLHWWREVVEGAKRRHEVAGPLADALAAGRLRADWLEGLFAAREAEMAGFATVSAWQDWLLQGAGGLAVAAARCLGAEDEPARVRRLGAAYGAAGVLRSVAAQARVGRCLLPEEALAAAGLTREGVVEAPGGAALDQVRRGLAGIGLAWLGSVAPMARAVLPAVLVAALARRDLALLGARSPAPQGRERPRGFGDRAAVLLAAAHKQV